MEALDRPQLPPGVVSLAAALQQPVAQASVRELVDLDLAVQLVAQRSELLVTLAEVCSAQLRISPLGGSAEPPLLPKETVYSAVVVELLEVEALELQLHLPEDLEVLLEPRWEVQSHPQMELRAHHTTRTVRKIRVAL